MPDAEMEDSATTISVEELVKENAALEAKIARLKHEKLQQELASLTVVEKSPNDDLVAAILAKLSATPGVKRALDPEEESYVPKRELAQATTAVVANLDLSDYESDDGDVDDNDNPPVPPSVRLALPHGPLNAVIDSDLADKLIKKAPQFKGESTKISFRLPEAINRDLPADEKKDSSVLTKTRRRMEKKTSQVLAGYQHGLRVVDLLDVIDTSFENLLKGTLTPDAAKQAQEDVRAAVAGARSHMMANLLLQAGSSRDLVDTYRRQVFISMQLQALSQPEMLQELRVLRKGKKTVVFDADEWHASTAKHSKQVKHLESVRKNVEGPRTGDVPGNVRHSGTRRGKRKFPRGNSGGGEPVAAGKKGGEKAKK